MEIIKHPILALRSLLFYVGYLIYLVIHGTLVFIFAPFMSYETRFPFLTLWTRFTVWWLKITCGVHYEVIGDSQTSIKNGVVLSKHQSGWETFFLQNLFIPQVTVLKKELLWIPIFGWAIRYLDPIVIDRSKRASALRQVMDQGKQRLEEGKWVTLYPEGTRVDPGKRLPFNAGGAMLAVKTGYPIVPVAHNAGEHWPAHNFIKYPGTIKVVVGPVMPTEGRSVKQVAAEVEEWINNTMMDISEIEKRAFSSQTANSGDSLNSLEAEANN